MTDTRTAQEMVERLTRDLHPTMKEAICPVWILREAATLIASQAEEIVAHLAAGKALHAAYDALEARALTAEAALAKAVEALKQIEEHPENSSDTSASYRIGWAFWNVQNIARRARIATTEKEQG